MTSFGARLGRSTRLLLSSSCLAAALCLPQAADAMEFHRNGDKIYVSGGVALGDDDRLARMLDAAAEAGIVINTVVFRTSPGGAAIAGKGMGNLIRERGLNTAVQGGCYSACTAGYVGGVERHDAIDDLPLVHPNYERTIFGIHGSASVKKDPNEYDVSVSTVDEDQSDIVNHYRGLLADEIPQEAMDRIDYAITHLKDSQGFLRYFVNNEGKVTTYCPSGDQGAGDCISYPGVTIRSDGIVNADTLDLSDDYLWVRDTVSGNINPNFRPFTISSQFIKEGDVAPTLEEAYGVIRVADGGVWHMTEATGADIIAAEKGGTIIVEPGTGAPARLIYDPGTLPYADREIEVAQWRVEMPTSSWIAALDGGTIDLRGGTLSSGLLTAIRKGGTLSGHGTIASDLSVGAGGTFVPGSIAVQPFLPLYEYDIALPSRINVKREDPVLSLGSGSETIFHISAGDSDPKIRLISAETIAPDFDGFFLNVIGRYITENHRGRLEIGPGATATLNVERGFFAPGARSTWAGVEYLEGPAHGNPADFLDYSEEDLATLKEYGLLQPKISKKLAIEGSFTTVRRDAEDAGIGFSDGAIFSPRENSLLTFTLHQDADSIYMVANPAFDDPAIFSNHRSGNGLGEALSAASAEEGTPLAPLLGSLQFANRDIARREAGSLRGDGHASLRLAAGHFANQFTSTLRTQVNGMRRLNGAAASDGEGEGVTAAPRDGKGTSFWIAGFGQTGKIARDGAIDRTDYDSYGSLFGVSHQIGDNFNIGAAFGYGRMDGRERPGSGIDSRVKAYGGSIYADVSYGRGYVSAQAGYHRLKNRTDRSIIDIEGLEGLNRARYSNDAVTVGLEHGIALNPGSKTRVTAIVPTVDYARLSSIDFAETGSAAALAGHDGAYESVRVGAGLEVSRNIATASGQRFAPYARLLYKRELGDREAVLSNGFALDPGLAFTTASRRLKRDIAEWGVGISSPANQAVTVSLDYAGQANDSFQNHSVKLGFNIRF